ncbi:hypothetical protein P3T76_015376 [Phytophthora citrophthora]|uniref:Uncharacterized protein n=1 Tax=Phytophthora citrophthora TaxID=4793 RepID=A0AAD9FZZ4_9STRA|nr:hypothetical protein P3T76_015376 [Phytophthora citrophthora]
MAPAIPHPNTVDIAYIYRRRNFVDVLENVSVLTPVTALCEQLCKRFNEGLNIDVSPEQIRLNTMLKVDSEWPPESDRYPAR